MSDIDSSPSKHKSFPFQDHEPKCINSLCNLINTRLKLLENEILSQHKAWESIQREVDEVKSLLEDCSSTCGSSTLSGHDNESEIVDSALESHKTCNSLLWNKLKVAEENVEEKKSLIRRLSSDVFKLKNFKKRCKKKIAKSNSHIDLILEVTNGLHVLKCDECKFCNEHLDFREGLLSSVIELIHFSEKNYSSSLEENKTLKSCLQKIYIKTKSCLLHSQIFSKRPHYQQTSSEAENGSSFVDSIYNSFEEFCHHFQNLQDELLQLKHILLAAEENHLDDMFQDPHSAGCRCYNVMRKEEHGISNDFDETTAKFSKTSQRNFNSYDRKMKSLGCDDSENVDPGSLFDSSQMFRTMSHSENQLGSLRSRLFETIRTIRDVEVEENDDVTLVNMVTSVVEECSALRQEVSYLRNVRQEKKKSWNKLQCFIMDAERKLKGSGRSMSSLREVIRDLGELIVTSESSSLDETILYMYSNQLEWLEKLSMGYESPSEQNHCNDEPVLENGSSSKKYETERTRSQSVSTQTSMCLLSETWTNENNSLCDIKTCDTAVQADSQLNIYSCESETFEPQFSEISREIYVVPEVMEETDSCYSVTCNNVTDSIESVTCSDFSNFQVSSSFEDESSMLENCSLKENASKSTAVLPFARKLSEIFDMLSKDRFGQLVMPHKLNKQFSFPVAGVPDRFFSEKENKFSHRNYDLTFSDMGDIDNSNMCLYMFLNQDPYMSHLFNYMLLNMLNENVKSVEICDEENQWSCILRKSDEFHPSLSTSDYSNKYLPYRTCAEGETKSLAYLGESSSGKSSETEHQVEISSIEELPIEEVFDKQDSSSFIAYNEQSPVTFTDLSVSNDSILNEVSNEPLELNIIDTELTACNEHSPIISTDLSVPNDSVLNEVNKEPLEPNIIDKEALTSAEINSSDTSDPRNEDDDSIIKKHPPVCREGTFIIESPESLHLKESKICNENFSYTAVLTALITNEQHKSETSYLLYELCKCQKPYEQIIGNSCADSGHDDKHMSVEHFVLCKATSDKDGENISGNSVSEICHLIFLKSNGNSEKKSVFESPNTNSPTLYPLLPQYVPVESLNYHDFEPLSLTHSCEIYVSDSSNNNDISYLENSTLIPKKYLKLKSLYSEEKVIDDVTSDFDTADDSPKECKLEPACSLFQMNSCTELPEVSNNEGNASNIFPLNDLGNVPQIKNAECQTEDIWTISSLPSQNTELDAPEENCSLQDNAKDAENVELSVTYCEQQLLPKVQDVIEMNDEFSQQSPDYIVNENSLIDEINALKDNLNQQNAVLQRLKNDLEDANLRLEDKEKELESMHINYSSHGEIVIINAVKEIDDKLCQTDFDEKFSRLEALDQEVKSLRLENLLQHEKIAHQNMTIQNVRAQLCTSISHLKHLKDAATKQLKKQKYQIMKSVKVKQQLQDTKIDLERKCEELEKNNELLSDQEFNLHEIQARLDATLEELKQKSHEHQLSKELAKRDCGSQTEEMEFQHFSKLQHSQASTVQHDAILKKHSEELLELQIKLQHLESVFSNKKDHSRALDDENINKGHNEVKISSHLKEGNIFKLLTISEQSYLSLLNKLADSLQISDLKGTTTVMHSSWLSCEDLSDARRQDHKKILQHLEKLKRNIRYLQENRHEPKRQNVESVCPDEKKQNFLCHSDEMHFQYLCDVLQRAQENLVKEYSQKKSYQRSVVTAGSVRINRHMGSRERKIPLELKNGKILALLDDKVNHKDLLPSKQDYSKMEAKTTNASFKSKTVS